MVGTAQARLCPPYEHRSSLRGAQRRRNPSLHKWRYGLLRFARNDDVAGVAATKQPDGQISKNLSSPSRKNIPLTPSGKSALRLRASRPMRGALRNVTNAR